MNKYFIVLLSFMCFIVSCSDNNYSENIGQVHQDLSSSANIVFTISDMYLSSSGWGENGSVFCDAQNRCISDHYNSTNASTGIVHFTNLPTCITLISATLNFSTTEWDAIIPKAEIRRILRSITIPASCPSGGAASSSTIGWRYASNGVPWSQLGAHGIGTDVSSESIAISVGSGANISHSVDVTTMIDSCIGSGTCDLAMFSAPDTNQTIPSHHFWLIVGSPTLVFTCDNSTSGTGGSQTTTSNSTTSTGGACN